MAYKTFGTEVLYADDVNDYLMNQAIVVCTSGTRPSPPVSGMHIWQTDTNTEHVYDGSAWRFTKGINQYAKKTADESVTSSTTLQNDDHLVVALEANGKYLIECLIRSNSPTAADIKFDWTYPSGATFKWSSHSPYTTNTNLDSSNVNPSSDVTFGGLGKIAGYGSDCLVFFRGILVTVGGTAGNMQLQWAQDTSNGSATTVKAGSYLYGRRVA